ncbi:NAD(P)/FAD-dependent oxidoreductase [Novosphingobium sp. MMS21-SN21R]|uniref:NAD(P)/FAD-dependent oxidoreductase n=1 Tax=Novosphingobium sp. MMS21-SN21R TaxID=2969298 RepID=UPI002887C9B6|nr:NAD(P)/FAD-dependent oxidoreductase [Novosphingobium sp. MMS21-SN21R]MDT0508372.1 NAD(P)/FAD-dependent oxidoreductase [Novosphingobium sp. MMS21-SN21R]
MSARHFDAIVLGAGAAGLMAALTAGQRGKRVLLVDHADEPGKKILISGGGRCNFTNIHTAADRYISENAHFARSSLARYTPADFIALVGRHGIAWHEKTLGQLFCDGSARAIVEMLMHECREGGVSFAFGQPISALDHGDGLYRVTIGGLEHHAPSVVLATGGLSIPKMGATGFALDIARRFGLPVVQTRPALVPFTLGEDEALFRSLSGLSAEVIARAGKAAFREAALFTHRGLSGPAMLQVSSYWEHRTPIHVDFLPDAAGDWLLDEKRNRPRATLRSVLGRRLPERLADTLADRIGLEGELSNCRDAALRTAQDQLARWEFTPNGTEGYAKAEVTAGGISTRALSQKSMESTKVPGLFAIGEAVDVTGWLGGYNFQWAWASGHAAGSSV